ncbi:recombinase family protein [Candidatus Paracaedibacter symbiosus]|uniref:recombinase family protein n=1 Tax=Candidatus Paracaedibacter symbiosus TaxID=244582 RepID=UPI00050985FA|nr:recombinase family protein [Candidatus Paracaedibacter symbiosus]
MKFGYARVSKNDQSLDIQMQKLQAAGCDEILMEKASGAKDDRKELNRLLDKIPSLVSTMKSKILIERFITFQDSKKYME